MQRNYGVFPTVINDIVVMINYFELIRYCYRNGDIIEQQSAISSSHTKN